MEAVWSADSWQVLGAVVGGEVERTQGRWQSSPTFPDLPFLGRAPLFSWRPFWQPSTVCLSSLGFQSSVLALLPGASVLVPLPRPYVLLAWVTVRAT